MRRTIFLNSLAQDAVVSAGSTRGGPNDSLFSPLNVIQRGIYSYWAPDECKDNWTIVLDLGKLASFNVLEVQEPIQMGQRVIAFHADVLREGEWMKITNGTTIGYKRLLLFPVVNSQFLRFVIDKSRADPLISYLGIYLDLFSSTAHYSLNSSSNSTSDVEFINQKSNNNYSMNIGSA
ncbi:Putative alpha-L-fucosidase 1 [Apostasia shenzhenica]|uniref:Alpha-L-fucosidase 1 n=1 Tax=Apostasia shenzhenica TaxID=1088818 RepID=A0A2H9ZRK7_9ASPA|nr:Putative alpha-L-fucosidase 1 [Apostasia shenzhenica]